MTDAYPLQWPPYRPRSTSKHQSRFGKYTIEQVRIGLTKEIFSLGGRDIVLSTNLRLRQDGNPYSTQAAPSDTGVAVYFTYKKQPMCFSCDKWEKITENIYAISMTIEALRGIARWGSGDMVQQAFTGFVALSAPKDPYIILGIRSDATDEEIEAAFKQQAKIRHPDLGGAPGAMQELNDARERIMNRKV